LVAAAKFLLEARKISFVVPNFVAATKPFFPCVWVWCQNHKPFMVLGVDFYRISLKPVNAQVYDSTALSLQQLLDDSIGFDCLDEIARATSLCPHW